MIIVLIVLAYSPLYACADKPYSLSYTLAATSPADDPSTRPIEARPGMPIAIDATAWGTYSGPISLTLPSMSVDLTYELKHGGDVIDTKKDSYPVDSMRIEPGKTYSQTGSKSYTLPSDLPPGDYTLDCTAAITVFGIGKAEHASFPVKVIGATTEGAPSGSGLTDVTQTSTLDAVQNCDMWHFPVLG